MRRDDGAGDPARAATEGTMALTRRYLLCGEGFNAEADDRASLERHPRRVGATLYERIDAPRRHGGDTMAETKRCAGPCGRTLPRDERRTRHGRDAAPPRRRR